MTAIRLDRYLADAGYGSRKDVKELLRKKYVFVNGTPATQADKKIDPEQDFVMVQGVQALYEEYAYYMLCKPKGVVSAARDSRDKTVVELITERGRRDLFPVGRLDKDTEGLLLITNNGKLANALLAPGHHVEKTYYAEVDGCVTEREIHMFEEGVDIGDDKLTAPARLKVLKADRISGVEITITEGRYHQIKRMFAACGMSVFYLKRLAMGPLWLDESLTPGDYRRLTEQEIETLLTYQAERV